MSKPSWTHPQCEACWCERNSFLGPNGVGVTVKIPVRLREPSIEKCAWCGMPTVVGIYVRENPNNVEFPAMEDDDAS